MTPLGGKRATLGLALGVGLLNKTSALWLGAGVGTGLRSTCQGPEEGGALAWAHALASL